MRQRLGLSVVFIVLLCAFSGLFGCAGTMSAIEHRTMTTNVNMQGDSIFLDAATLESARTAYVRVTNTSQMQEIQLEGLLRDKLTQKGVNLVTNPKQASYIIQANVLYMDFAKKGITADGMLVGGYGGGVAGAALSQGGLGSAAGIGVGAIAGAVIGGVVGSTIHVDSYIGALDLQIQERVEGGVTGNVITNAKQGNSSELKTQHTVHSDYQTYRTRIVASAVQTNISKDEAAAVLTDKLASQIAGMF